MELKEVLDQKIVKLDLKASNKEEALQELSELLYSNGYITDISSFKKDIYLREEEGITGIGNFIAIPHGKSDSVSKIGIAIGKVSDPIEWESIDGEGVKFIFLFAVSNDVEYAKNHMKLLAQIAGCLGNDKKIAKLLTSNSYHEIVEVFTS